jgi:beta-glucanase (GH16 family)
MTDFHRLCLALLLGLVSVTGYSQCYELVWADEFDSIGFPSGEYWNFETGGGGWGNNELQYYRRDSTNAYVNDGVLTITARKQSYGGRDYTSARINTRDKFEFQYGKIEARMRLPYGQGLWPAFWMMGEDISQVGWPACGETDIMEMIGGTGRDNTVHGTAHWDNNGSHASYGNGYTLPSGIFADTFHVFTVEWTPQVIRWSMDGIQFNVIDITSAGLSEFHHDFFIILNLAVGGNWPGSPDGTTVFPQTLEVDYIRVFQNPQFMQVRGPAEVAELTGGHVFSLPEMDSLEYNWTVPEGASITEGQGTPQVTVDWGCSAGEVGCTLTLSCGSSEVSFPVKVDNRIEGPVFVDPGASGVEFSVTGMPGTNYAWAVPADATITEGDGTSSISVAWGDLFTPVTLTTTNECGTAEYSHMVYGTGQYPFPDPAVPHLLPGSIEAVDFDYGGEGLAYHDLSATNEGDGPRQDENVDTQYSDNSNPNVGWIRDGEWLEYTIRVDSTWAYNLAVRVASSADGPGPFSILVNGEERMTGITVSNTGGWDRFITRNIGRVPLYTTDTLLRIRADHGDFNLGKMTFTYASSTSVPGLTAGPEGLQLYPNPAQAELILSGPTGGFTFRIVDIAGIVMEEGRTENDEVHLDISMLPPGSYMVITILPGKNVQTARFIKLP